MLKRFIDGLVFGSGFTVSLLAVWYVVSVVIVPKFYGPSVEYTEMESLPETGKTRYESRPAMDYGSVQSFIDLSVDEQIEQASAIALAEHKPAPDGQMKAIIYDFIKKDASTDIHYKIGDEFPSASYYPRENSVSADGIVIFFNENPARMKSYMPYYGDRVAGLGDIPLQLLRDKCDDASSNLP